MAMPSWGATLKLFDKEVLKDFLRMVLSMAFADFDWSLRPHRIHGIIHSHRNPQVECRRNRRVKIGKTEDRRNNFEVIRVFHCQTLKKTIREIRNGFL